jgi:hypothetical protein
MHMPTRLAAILALAILPTIAGAQAKWKEIGRTSSGNMVSIDPRSVKRTGGIVAATVRVVYATPVQMPRGPLVSTRTKAMFDCAARKMAVSENDMYADARGTKVIEHRVNRIPGYGTIIKGTPTDLAFGNLCATK